MVLIATPAQLASGFTCRVCKAARVAGTTDTSARCPNCKQTYTESPDTKGVPE